MNGSKIQECDKHSERPVVALLASGRWACKECVLELKLNYNKKSLEDHESRRILLIRLIGELEYQLEEERNKYTKIDLD